MRRIWLDPDEWWALGLTVVVATCVALLVWHPTKSLADQGYHKLGTVAGETFYAKQVGANLELSSRGVADRLCNGSAPARPVGAPICASASDRASVFAQVVPVGVRPVITNGNDRFTVTLLPMGQYRIAVAVAHDASLASAYLLPAPR